MRWAGTGTATFAALALLLTSSCSSSPSAPSSSSSPSSSVPSTEVSAMRTPCVGPGRISVLNSFATTVGRSISCVVIYNNAAPDWAGWEAPWFTHQKIVDLNWKAWATAQPGRTLVISQSMIPAGVPSDWAQRGARGDYDANATALGRNLVAAGLGHSIIRLGFEANDPSMNDALGPTTSDVQAWRVYWARIVRAMRAVSGAHFVFDWTVNAGYRPLDFSSYYPGDDVVDVIGIDAYDASVQHAKFSSADARWKAIYGQPAGLAKLAAFAESHRKPISIPEWGLVKPPAGAGDDPRYVEGIADFVRTHTVVYQSYFLTGQGGVIPLDQAPGSLASYRAHFGPQGDSVG